MGDYQRLQTDAETEIVVDSKTPRSLIHKLLFFGSTTCILAVICIFLWGLPCDMDSCEAPKRSISWDKTLYGLELKGRMHLVGGHLVCILRAALWGKISNGFTPHTGGVIALSASSGKTVWYVPLPITPEHIDCTLLGQRRCLILGDKGFLMAIDYLSGISAWKVRSPNASIYPQPEDIEFPLVIPERGELITLSRFKTGGHRLLFVNMETGMIISEPLVNSECYHVYNLTYSINEETLHYACSTKLGEARVMALKLAENKNKRGKAMREEPIDLSKRLHNDSVHNDQQIIVTNTGSCPRNCNTAIEVSDSSNKTVWKFNETRTYALAPLPLHFRPQITGFLIKLLHWHDQPGKTSNGTIVEMIRERIVLITFNKTGSMHAVNASQTDIIQLCSLTNECQPELSYQTQSALLVDVNGDGQQDLISYFVTYQPSNEEDRFPDRVKDWELQSKVRVVHLEAELPMLYDSMKKR